MIRAFFSFEGRMNRKPFWLWGLALLAIIVVAAGAYFAMLGIRNPTLSDAQIEEKSNPFLWLLTAVTLWPTFALTIKRLSDRDRAWWWSLPMILPGYAQSIAAEITHTEGLFLSKSPIMLALDAAMVVTTLWFLIECGFLRGTDGPNRYGPDPLRRDGPAANEAKVA